MGNILDTIVAYKRREVEAAIRTYGLHVENHHPERVHVDMKQSLLKSPTGIIAEFKRRSPSKGDIHPMADVAQVVPGYEKRGASACSILTDTPFFGGATTDLMVARPLVGLPILRKDFVVHKRQIEEAAAIGADAVLLIAAVLTTDEIVDFTDFAHSLGLQVLFEVHNERELAKFYDGVDMVGVNNRDLTTFHTDVDLSSKVVEKLPERVLKVAESGLTSISEVQKLRQAGYRGFLIGETFMKHADPAEALQLFLENKL